MNGRVAFPFLTLRDSSVCASTWKIGIGDSDPADSGDWIADWDASTPLRVSRSIGIDFEAAARDLEMEPNGLQLAASLRIGTGPGRLARAILGREQRILTVEEPVAVFERIVEGTGLSTILELHVDLILAKEHARGSALSPARKGDRVWQETARMRLEGEEPRLPIEATDLSRILAGTAGLAPWYLDWSPRDWFRDFHGAIRLYLNSRDRALVARVETEDPEILRAIMADVMGQVCECLARDPQATWIVGNCGEGTLGAQAAHWLALAFPGRDIVHARGILEQRPGLFRAAMQALADQRVEGA